MRRTRIQYGVISSPVELRQWVRQYVDTVVSAYNLEVETDWIIQIEISKQMKRDAAKLEYFEVPSASVGKRISSWGEIDDAYAEIVDTVCFSDSLKDCKLILSWEAFEVFPQSVFEQVIRHELVHVEQFQLYGTTNHGDEFKQRIEHVDSRVSFPIFSPYEYVLNCQCCHSFVLGRYHESKYVKQANNVLSECCGASCYVTNHKV